MLNTLFIPVIQPRNNAQSLAQPFEATHPVISLQVVEKDMAFSFQKQAFSMIGLFDEPWFNGNLGRALEFIYCLNEFGRIL